MKKIVLYAFVGAPLFFCACAAKYPSQKLAFGDAVGTGDIFKATKLMPLGGANVKDRYGRTVLYVSVSVENPEMASLLLKNGANPRCRESNGKTAFEAVFWGERADIIERFLHENIYFNAEEAHRGFEILSKHNFGERSSYIALEKMGAKNKDACLVLSAESLQEGVSPKCIPILLELGANIQRDQNKNVIEIALRRKHLELISFFIDKRLLNASEATKALQVFVEKDALNPCYLRQLIGLEGRLDFVVGGKTPIEIFLQRKNLEMLDALLREDKSLVLSENETIRALALSVEKNNLPLLDRLSSDSTLLNARHEKCWSIFMNAVYHGNQEIVKLLSSKGGVLTELEVTELLDYAIQKKDILTLNKALRRYAFDNPEYAYRVGMLAYERSDFKTATEFLRGSADCGNRNAQEMLMYKNGKRPDVSRISFVRRLAIRKVYDTEQSYDMEQIRVAPNERSRSGADTATPLWELPASNISLYGDENKSFVVGSGGGGGAESSR